MYIYGCPLTFFFFFFFFLNMFFKWQLCNTQASNWGHAHIFTIHAAAAYCSVRGHCSMMIRPLCGMYTYCIGIC